MNRNTINLGKILGIPVGLDPSWFLIFVLVTWSLAVDYFPGEFKDWSTIEYWIVGGITAIIFFLSVVLHELGHSIIALCYKIPVKSITLYIFGGIAAIETEPPSAIAEFWIALAGPAVSLGLAVLFWLMQAVLAFSAPILAVAKYMAAINFSLGLFNLIPGFPLDGGRVLRAFLWGAMKNLRRATRIAATVGRLIAYGFILIGVWQLFTGQVGNGLWIAFIGWFLNNAAGAQLQQQTLQDILEGHRVYEVMNRSFATVESTTTLQTLVDDHILGSGRRCFMVMRDGKEIGLLTVHHVKLIPRETWSTTTVAQAMIPIDQVKQVGPALELWPTLEQMDRDGVNQLPVIVEGRCQGMISREDIVSFLRTRRELGI
ncbi:MAG: site-2 protease family protein [Anaerolineales bacterium]|nr:site-2 protease family protein [Anaerolineales bacterium]